MLGGSNEPLNQGLPNSEMAETFLCKLFENRNSIFVKFRIKEKDNEFLVIWTTTPWTIPFNLAVMANPYVDYVRIKVDGEVWIVANALVGVFMGGVVDKKYEIIETLKGDKQSEKE